MRTALYRHYDADGGLLYVGISLCAVSRLAQHRLAAKWYSDIRRVEVEWFNNRPAAVDAEKLAIVKEKPRHNIVGTKVTLRLTDDERPWAVFQVDTGCVNGWFNYGAAENPAERAAQLAWHNAFWPEYEHIIMLRTAHNADYVNEHSSLVSVMRDMPPEERVKRLKAAGASC